MRRSFWCLIAVGIALPLGAQQRGTGVATTAVNIYNARTTMRVSGALDVEAGREIVGDVAVLNGPVVVSGRVTGSLVAINADVRLVGGASIGQHLIVVGGTVTREDGVTIGGEVRTQAELLFYDLEGDRIVVEERGIDWRPRWSGPGLADRGESYTDLLFVAARSYNRVEGLSASVGPRFRRPTSWGRVQVSAFGVVRTASPIRWDRGTIGHDFRADLRLGVRNGLVVGARAYDVIDPVESWQLTDTEAGLASFVLHRDMRDWYGRHGGEGSIGARIGEEVTLSFAAGSERWRSVDARRPFTVLRDNERWRENASMDAGTVDLASVRLRVDTRDKPRALWLGGWYVNADIEHGRGTIARYPGDPVSAPPVPEPVNYSRFFVDARRYNKIAAGTELNLRIVTGGQLGGDSLPMQRRLSVGGPGSIDGYDFRRAPHDIDVFTCGGMADRLGRPTLCDRIAVAQVELRQSFEIHLFRDDDDDWWRPRFNSRGAWVLYADAGRGWTVERGDPGIRHDRGLPPLSTFRTSVGAGVDFGSLAVYVAKATSTGREPMNVVVRLGRRF